MMKRRVSNAAGNGLPDGIGEANTFMFESCVRVTIILLWLIQYNTVHNIIDEL